MDLEIPPLLQTRGAEVTFLIAGRVRETAVGAVRWEHGSDSLVAVRAHDEGFPRPAEEGPTDGADRRKDEVQQPREDLGGPHLKIPRH